MTEDSFFLKTKSSTYMLDFKFCTDLMLKFFSETLDLL